MAAQSLKAMIICNDGRNDACIKLLQQQVPELYMLKAGRCRKFTPDEPKGLSIPRRQLPKSVNVLIFHSPDWAFWKDVNIHANYTFEFNTPGTPQPKPGVIPIYRQTFPNFAIKSHDAEELIDFISGRRLQLPSMCQTPITFDLLPALTTLCQCYIESPDEELTKPIWWLESLGLVDKGLLNQDLCNQILKNLDRECISVPEFQFVHDSLEEFLDGLLIEKGGIYVANSSSIDREMVDYVYRLTNQLLQSNGVALSSPSDNEFDPLPEAILALKGGFLGRAAAAVVAKQFSLKRKILDPGQIDGIDQLPNSSILVLTDAQVSHLPALRLKDFRGGVLVLSQNSFVSLKRQYRVLRFGQGSHDALATPFKLSDLYAKLRNLVPMEPENLRFFQDEMRAVDSIYLKEIVPYLNQLEQSASSSEINTAMLVSLSERMRSETPVACHTIVTIENQTLQIQQHLRRVLTNLEKTNDLQSESTYLKAIFEEWYQLVRSAAGESLKSAA